MNYTLQWLKYKMLNRPCESLSVFMYLPFTKRVCVWCKYDLGMSEHRGLILINVLNIILFSIVHSTIEYISAVLINSWPLGCLKLLYFQQGYAWYFTNTNCMSVHKKYLKSNLHIYFWQFLKQSKPLRNAQCIPPEEDVESLTTTAPSYGHARDAFAFGVLAQNMLEYLGDLGGYLFYKSSLF